MKRAVIIIFALVVLVIVFSILGARCLEHQKNVELLKIANLTMETNLSEGFLVCGNITSEKESAVCYFRYLGLKMISIRESYPNLSIRAEMVDNEITKVCGILENNSYSRDNCDSLIYEITKRKTEQKVASLDKVKKKLETNPDAVLNIRSVLCESPKRGENISEVSREFFVFDDQCQKPQVWWLFDYTSNKTNETLAHVYTDPKGNIKIIG